jgi:DNA modification methylase
LLILGNALNIPLANNSVQCTVTSPPYYGLRDYGVSGQLGLEQSPEEYVEKMVDVFREVKRVLRDDGTLWLNMGDSYAQGGNGPGSEYYRDKCAGIGTADARALAPKKAPNGYKPKDLLGIPWRLAFALQADGWWLRSDIIWAKPNPMPESVRDRPTKSHEYLFLLTKSARYYYDANAVREPSADPDGWSKRCEYDFTGRPGLIMPDGKPQGIAVIGRREPNIGRNRRTVWTIPTAPYKGAHFATYPPALVEPCILAGSKEGDIVLDPFCGSGTTGEVSIKLNRQFVGIELNPQYIELAKQRMSKLQVRLLN